MDPRVLLGAMMKKLPDGKSIKEDLVPGGDLRSKGNGWLRSAFKSSGMKKVPREGQMRLAVKKLIGKKKWGIPTKTSNLCIDAPLRYWYI